MRKGLLASVCFVACLLVLSSAVATGSISLIMVVGRSMRPILMGGDLVVVRRRLTYEQGEIVAFRVPEGVVIHRIIGGSPDAGYVVQGDNKEVPDDWRPRPSDILGSMWFRVPYAGLTAARLRQPLLLATLAVGLTLLAVETPKPKRKTKARRRPRTRAPRAPGLARGLLVSAGVAGGLALLALAAFVYTRYLPLTVPRRVSEPLYTHTAAFRYSVLVERSDLYPDTRLGPYGPAAGDEGADPPLSTVFTQLAEGVSLVVDYALETGASADVQGTAGAALEIRAGDAWAKSLPLFPPTPFEGRTVRLPLSVTFAEVTELTRSIEEQTGYRPGSYTVVVVPGIHVTGTVGDRAVDDTYSPAFRMTLGASQITLDTDLSRSEARTVTRTDAVENTVDVWRFSAPVATLREIGRMALLVCGGAALVLLVALAWAARGPVGRIQARYGGLLVSATHIDTHGARTVDVASMDDLARLAHRDGQVILHHEMAPGRHRFVVDDGRLVYVYRVHEGPAVEVGEE